MSLARRAAVLLVLVLLPVATLASCGGGGEGSTAATTATGGATAEAPASGEQAGLGQVPAVYREVQPSVVSVLVRRGGAHGEGSGVVWDAHTVVTNSHVVEGASSVELALASGERVRARVGARDPRTDLAVLHVPDRELPPAEFARELPEVGELAIALGAPLGFENTVTAGIVSGLERSIPSGGRTPALVGLVQTDAAISPGNSGGALVDARGEVIGLNVAFIPPQARAVSIGFAIPAPVVRDVVPQLLRDGRVEHPYLGVNLRPLTAQIAERLDVGTDRGAVVIGVEDGSPASEAGVRAGDVLIELAGTRISSVEDVLAALRDHEPGDRIELTVVRDGARRTLGLTVGSRPQG
jgi:S1-C subfamily serine protease